MSQTTAGSSEEDAPIKYVCGIDVGSQSCSGCVCRPDKSVVIKPVTFANAKEGWEVLFEKLTRLDAVPNTTAALRQQNGRLAVCYGTVCPCFNVASPTRPI